MAELDIEPTGVVRLNGDWIGHVHPGARINGKHIWRAWDRTGQQQPVTGNRAFGTREAAAEALVKAVRR